MEKKERNHSVTFRNAICKQRAGIVSGPQPSNHLALHTFERFRSIISTLAPPPPPPRMVRSMFYTLRNMQDRRFSFEIATLNDR